MYELVFINSIEYNFLNVTHSRQINKPICLMKYKITRICTNNKQKFTTFYQWFSQFQGTENSAVPYFTSNYFRSPSATLVMFIQILNATVFIFRYYILLKLDLLLHFYISFWQNLMNTLCSIRSIAKCVEHKMKCLPNGASLRLAGELITVTAK